MKYPMAILDYGIGGLDLLKLIKSDFPEMPVLYFSDSGFTPYGRLNEEQLRQRVYTVLDTIRKFDVGHIVVACHSASAVLYDNEPNTTGMKQATIDAVLQKKPKSLGIVGGGRTIKQGYYAKTFQEAGIFVKQQIAQELSILVERGELNSHYTRDTISGIFEPLKSVDAILLACTHYPVLAALIAKKLNEKIDLIDPIKKVYERILPQCRDDLIGDDIFLSTGNVELMKKAARISFGIEIDRVESTVI